MLYRDLKPVLLDDYLPPRVDITCVLCDRRGHLRTAPLRETYGGNISMGELAHRVAGTAGCTHQPTFCSAFPAEPTLEHWASLHHAWQGQWRCFLRCHRSMVALKRADSCPEVVELRVDNLKAMFGHSMPLDRLRTKLHCPSCETRSISLQWVPPPFTPPAAKPNHLELTSYERLRRAG